MSLIDLIFGKKKNTASLAKERLQIILAHERSGGAESNNEITWLPALQEELMQVIAKYISIDKDALRVNLEKRDNLELLEINVTLPEKEGEK